jgi:F0F1-type ATP synthase delta subunit
MSTSQHLARALVSLVKDDGLSENDAVHLFLRFSEKRGLHGYVPSVLMWLKRDAQSQEHLDTVTIESRLKISKEMVSHIVHALGVSSKTKIVTKEEESLIGGFVATYGYEIYDASVRTQLNQLRTVLQD